MIGAIMQSFAERIDAASSADELQAILAELAVIARTERPPWVFGIIALAESHLQGRFGIAVDTLSRLDPREAGRRAEMIDQVGTVGAAILVALLDRSRGGHPAYRIEEQLVFAVTRCCFARDAVAQAIRHLEVKRLVRRADLRTVTLCSDDERFRVESAPLEDTPVLALTPSGARVAAIVRPASPPL